MRNNNIRPITVLQDVGNNFNLVSVDECYVLIVHADLETDIQDNLGADFIHKTQYVGKGFAAIDASEIGYIPKYKTRVICTHFVEVRGDVAAASTAGRRQSAGGVNNTYHNIMLGAEAFAIPGFGKVVDVNLEVSPGNNKTIQKLQGIDFWRFNAEHSASDPAGLNLGIGYQFWMGDTSGARGGILLPSLNRAGTTVYKCAKIITAASA
jgi:N4-gp56 family major capsid protein